MKKILATSILLALSAPALAKSVSALDIVEDQTRTLKIPDILNPEKGDLKEIPYEEIGQPDFVRQGPTVQVAVLLDTSNSMDGLIHQVKTQLWSIVNDVSKANKDQKNVVLQVALYEYGKRTLPQHTGYVQQTSPFTSDLDQISESLFNLHTDGGAEYAGRAILESVSRLAWSDHPDDLRLIIIAGNEPFNQGRISYEKAIDAAYRQDITVNTVFCGDRRQGIEMKWADGAARGDGKYLNIAQNDDIRHIVTPYDEHINRLGDELNDTYIQYGAQGSVKKARQSKMDTMAAKESEAVIAERNIAKASKSYDAKSWDIVSLFSSKGSSEASEKIASSDAFRNMEHDEAMQKIKASAEKRTQLQKEIQSLQRQREDYIKRQNPDKDMSFGTVLIKEIRNQAENKGYSFDDN